MENLKSRQLSRRVRPLFPWPGGKSRHLKRILPLIESRPHTCYVEPFAGALAVLLAKPRSGREVVNDLNHDLVTTYRYVRLHPDALCAEFQHAVASRADFLAIREHRALTELQRAVQFIMGQQLSFGGGGPKGGFAVSKTKGGRGYFTRERLFESIAQLTDRLDRVTVENLSWQRCLDLYDSPESLIFLDPPYLRAEIKAYAGWSETQILELRDRLRTVKGNGFSHLTLPSSTRRHSVSGPWRSSPPQTRPATPGSAPRPCAKSS